MRVNGVIIIWAVPRKPESASKVNFPYASVINPPLLLDHKKSRRGVMRKHPLPSITQIATSSALYFWTDLTTCVHLVTQLCPTFYDPLNHSPPGSSVQGDSPDKNTGVGCHALLQGIFPTQGLNPGLPHCRQILYQLSHQGRPGCWNKCWLEECMWDLSILVDTKSGNHHVWGGQSLYSREFVGCASQQIGKFGGFVHTNSLWWKMTSF